MPAGTESKRWLNRMSAVLSERVTAAVDRLAHLLGRDGAEAAHLRTGREGERLAYYFLRRQGYTMVARNWRTRGRKGEIDLIGFEGEVLCFIEVKTRTSHAVAPAEAAVDAGKQRELRAMAARYLRHRSPRPPTRFDVVSVYLAADRAPEIELFKDAFAWRSMSGRRRPPS
jgi:putative endonuclease